MRGTNSDYLFPGVSGKPKTANMFGGQITDRAAHQKPVKGGASESVFCQAHNLKVTGSNAAHYRE
jgi:hypothetical protein